MFGESLSCAWHLSFAYVVDRVGSDTLTLLDWMIRERAAGRYCTSAYYVASMLIEIPLLAIIVAGYGTLAYKLVGLNPSSGRFELFLCIIFLVINVGFSWSQLLAACSSSVSVAIAGFMVVLVYAIFHDRITRPTSHGRYVTHTAYGCDGLSVY